MVHVDFDYETHDPIAIFYDKNEAIHFADSEFTNCVCVYKWKIGKDYYCEKKEIVWEK